MKPLAVQPSPAYRAARCGKQGWHDGLNAAVGATEKLA
jgi:hypothetical protein